MQFKAQRTLISLAVTSLCAYAAMPALAQEAAKAEVLDTVVVTGVRASLEKSLNLKREAIGTRDSIIAEDIGKFPEQNIADALQRLPGIEVLKDPATNEGQRIQMRGLPSEYTVTLFNGAPVRATSGGNIGSATRDFNYDIFPSELFSRVDVYKTPEAFLEEGGAAGVVDMRTPRPFDFKGQKITYSAAVTQNKSNGSTNPRAQALYSNTWGNFGVLVQGSLTKASQGTAGASSTGHFSDSRQGSALPAGVTLLVPGETTPRGIGRQFNMDVNTDHPLAKLGSYTAAQVRSAFLPRLMRSVTQVADRERQGFNSSLQFKNERWNISLDSVFARLETESKTNGAVFNVRDSTCGRFLSPTGQASTSTTPGSICSDSATRNATTGSFNNALIPLNVSIDANNMLSGTFGNFQYATSSAWSLSKTKFDYHALNVEFKATDALTLNAQLSDNKSVAWRSQTTMGADTANTYADGVMASTTGTSGFTLAPGVINRHTLTFDLSNPLFPKISSNLDLLDPKRHSTFSNTGGGYVTEIDKQRIAKLNAAYEYELGGLRGLLKGGLSLVDSTKSVDQRSVPNLINGLTLPNGKLFSAATLNERAEFMRGFMVKNDASNVSVSGDGFPREFLVFDTNTLKNTFNALELNRNAPQNLPSSFTTVEKVSAAYLQNDLEFDVFGRPLRTNVGVRHVKTEVDIDNFQADGAGGFAAANRVSEYSHTLPSFSVAYDVIRNVVLRASAGKTFKRSSVSAISRTFGVRGSGGDLTVNAGNPELLPEESSSRDWGAEWYFAKGGVVALAGYDKSFTGRLKDGETVVPFNTIGLPKSLFTANNFTLSDNPDTRVFLPTNAEAFKIKGLELAYQQSFSFLPAPFNGLGVYGSYTKNKTLGVERTYSTLDANGAIIHTKGTVPLVPEDTYSIATYFEQGPLFLRLSYNHKSEWASGDTGSNGYGFQRFNIERGYLDASVGYKFSKALEVRFDATNITNQKTYEVFRHIEGKFGDEHSRIEGGLQAGRGFSISLRGSF
jgi:iron complex outermembrane recepter protein